MRKYGMSEVEMPKADASSGPLKMEDPKADASKAAGKGKKKK
jgi:large subunit ribosomal protein L31